jgi:hypothetical protein
MTVRAIKLPFKAAAIVGGLSAAALVASALPAQAESVVVLTGFLGRTEQFTCKVTTHGINITPLTSANNGCSNRLWLHQNLNGSGWGYCVSGHKDVSVPTKYDGAQQAQVVSNTAKC